VRDENRPLKRLQQHDARLSSKHLRGGTPSNTFTLGARTKNKKKGTATLTIADLPNPGDLTASGNGVKAASPRQSRNTDRGAGIMSPLL
jgi:hypothetical protein